MTYTHRNSHVSDDNLELYALNRLEENDVPALEEHLMICHECQDRLDDTDQYIRAMKVATGALRQQRPGLLARFVEWIRFVPQPALAFGFAAVIALLFIVRLPQASVETIDLSAMRDVASQAHVRSNTIPQLRLSAEGLAVSESYSVEVVNEGGSRVWEGSSSAKDQKIVVSLSSKLNVGTYWVRVYKDATRRQLLREYGLTVD